MEKDDIQDAINMLTATAKINGAAAMTTSDSHIILITRDKMEAIMQSNPTGEQFLIMIKKQPSKEQMN